MSETIARLYGGEAVVMTQLAEVETETAQKNTFTFQMGFLNVWKKDRRQLEDSRFGPNRSQDTGKVIKFCETVPTSESTRLRGRPMC